MEDSLLFLDFLLLGVYLDFVYEGVNLVRRLVSNKIFTFITDILTVIGFGVVTFFYFCAYTDGRARALPLFCEAAGFLTVRLTLGQLSNLFYIVLRKDILQKFLKIFKKIKRNAENLLKNCFNLLYNIFEKKEKEVVKNARSKKRKSKKEKKSG